MFTAEEPDLAARCIVMKHVVGHSDEAASMRIFHALRELALSLPIGLYERFEAIESGTEVGERIAHQVQRLDLDVPPSATPAAKTDAHHERDLQPLALREQERSVGERCIQESMRAAKRYPL
jgi:hypothetical protein